MRAVLVPVKSFREAKHRLAPALAPALRAALAQSLAARVFSAAGSIRVSVACDDGEVADWASARGAEVLFTPHLGLSGAVSAAVEHLGRAGASLVVVSHADLPFAHDLDSFGSAHTVTLAPDHRVDGTNVIAVPPGFGFRFSYGRGSYARHRAEAERLGLAPRTVYDARLAADIDFPEDLAQIAPLVAELSLAQIAPVPTCAGP